VLKRQTLCHADNNATDKKQQEIHYGNGYGVFHSIDFGIMPQTENALRIRTAHSESERQTWSFSYRLPTSISSSHKHQQNHMP